MEIKQLITFKVAADHLNFTQTARILNFAQSSVTAQIKSLEAELGTPLFERLGKRLILTDEGKKFKLYAEKMISISEEAKVAVSGVEEPTGTLHIGAQESQCTYRLPALLKKFQEQFPKVKLIFKQAHSNQHARKQLLEGKLDLAFIMDQPEKNDPSLTVEPLIEEDLKIVVPSNYPSRTFPSEFDLNQETFLLTEDGCSYRSILEESLNLEGFNIQNKFEFVSIEAVKQCVISGLGIAIFPSMVIQKEVSEGQLKEVMWESNAPSIFTQIAWHKDKWMTPPLLSFIDLTRQMLHE